MDPLQSFPSTPESEDPCPAVQNDSYCFFGRQRQILLVLSDLTRKVFQENGISVKDLQESYGSLFHC